MPAVEKYISITPEKSKAIGHVKFYIRDSISN
jgi:hypothetical protein